MKLKEIKETAKTVKGLLDTDGDGVISKAEILNPQNIKLILITIISLMTPSILEWVGECIEQKKYVSNGIEDLAGLIIVPFILIYFFKTVVDDYQGRLKQKDLSITTLKISLNNEKADRREDRAKSDLAILQIEGALEMKDIEIGWIKDGYIKKNTPVSKEVLPG